MNSTNPCYKRNPDVIARSIGGEKVLVPIKNNQGDLESIFRLNEVGAVAWDCLASDISFEKLVEAIQKEFDVDAATARTDLTAFLSDLQSAHLLEASE